MRKIYIAIFLLQTGFFLNLFGQQPNTLYFMKNNPLRHELNPAFQPECKFYIGFPGLSSIYFGAGNNSFTFSDIYKSRTVGGEKQTVLFLHPEVENGTTDFLKKYRKNLKINSDLGLDLLTFGFRSGKSYFTVGLSTKTDMYMIVPKAIPQVFFDGAKEDGVTNFDLHDLAFSATSYTELALGYSYDYDERWSFGGKLKLLAGQANVYSDFGNINLKISKKKWILDGSGSINASIPGLSVNSNDDGTLDDLQFDGDGSFSDYLKPSGYGLGADLGGTFNLLPNLQFSASVLDLAFIRWTKNLNKVGKNGDFVFNGIVYDVHNDSINYWEEYGDMLKNMFETDKNPSSYTTFLTGKVFLGAEYSILNDKIGFGLLSKSYIIRSKIFEELSVSSNFRPFYPLSASITYSLLDGKWSNLGLGLNFNAGPVNLFLIADQIPLKYAKGDDFLVPTMTKNVNFSVGLNFVFGKKSLQEKEKQLQEKERQLHEKELELQQKEQQMQHEKLRKQQAEKQLQITPPLPDEAAKDSLLLPEDFSSNPADDMPLPDSIKNETNQSEKEFSLPETSAEQNPKTLPETQIQEINQQLKESVQPQESNQSEPLIQPKKLNQSGDLSE